MTTDGYDWDPSKASANVRKHGVRFSDAAIALEDPLSMTMVEPGSKRLATPSERRRYQER